MEIQEFNCNAVLREINFSKIWISKMAISTILETLNFEFWQIWDLKDASEPLKLPITTFLDCFN